MVVLNAKAPTPLIKEALPYIEPLQSGETFTTGDDPGRTFTSGAYRDGEKGKLDYEGILSPRALKMYARYLDRHRLQSNGVLRDTDNWQKGMPKKAYMKSLWRHLVAAWSVHRGDGTEEELEEALCGVLFNAFGYLHEMGREDLTETDKQLAEVARSEMEKIVMEPGEKAHLQGPSETSKPWASVPAHGW